jgi:hypothetical protein
MADDVAIYSPLFPAPYKGKEQVADVLAALVSSVDAFESMMLLCDDAGERRLGLTMRLAR